MHTKENGVAGVLGLRVPNPVVKVEKREQGIVLTRPLKTVVFLVWDLEQIGKCATAHYA